MTMKEKLMGIFSKSLDEAMVEETPPAAQDQQPDMAQVLAAIMGRLDAIEAALKPAGDGETPPAAGEGEQPPAGEGEGTPAAEGDHTPEEMSALEQRLSTIEQALAKLAGLEESEHGVEVELAGDMCKDAETIARAEILAPGIAKTADVKAKALTAAYGTEDGKAVIDSLLAGKTFDSADKDMLFVAASEMLKSVRRSQLNARVSLDSLPSMKSGDMTPEKINAMNAARYGNQSK
jgi:hypothetical protein